MGAVSLVKSARFTHNTIMVIAPLNLVLACLVAAAAVSSAEPIDVNSDYSIEPSDRVCHPYCGDDQDQDWDISEGAGVSSIGDALDKEEGSVAAEGSGHLTKRSPLVPFPFPWKPISVPKKFPFKFPKKFPGKKLLKKLPLKKLKKLPLKKFTKLPLKKFKKLSLKKLPFKAVKKIPLKKFKKPVKKVFVKKAPKFVAKKAPAAVLTGGAGLAAGGAGFGATSLLGGAGLPSLPAIPAVGGLLPFLPGALRNFG